MNNTPRAHIVRSFDKDVNQLESLLVEMGGLVETQIADAAIALIRRDTDLADKVKAGDKKVDALEVEINEMAVNMLALRQPMAEDLRRVIATLKVSAGLERIGDLAKNIAKRTAVLAQTPPVGSSLHTVKRMSQMVRDMICQVIDAFMTRDIQTANDIRMRDEEVDQLHNTLFRELLTYMMEDPRNISPCMHLLFIVKNLERSGDHATGIAEQVHYLVTGAMPDDDRPKCDETSTMHINPFDTGRGE